MSWAKLVSLGDPQLRMALRKRSKECRFLIGRNPDCTLVLHDMHISARHVSIITRTDSFGELAVFVKDSSTNGTWLDGERLEKGKEVQLRNGNQIRLACEDDAWDLHTFKFSSQSGSYSTVGSIDAMSSQTEGVNGTTAASLKEVSELQDKVSTEASRLVACIYNNNEMFAKLLNVAQNQPSSDSLGNDTEVALLTSNQNLRFLLSEMMGTLKDVKGVLDQARSHGGESGPEDDVDTIVQKVDAALAFDSWKTTLDALDEQVQPQILSNEQGDDSPTQPTRDNSVVEQRTVELADPTEAE